MANMAFFSSQLFHAILFLALILTVVFGMIVSSYFLGQRRKHGKRELQYESGMNATGSAKARLSIPYYLVPIFFLIFHLEAIFIFAWAVSLKAGGWNAYIEMAIFIVVLMVGLIYIWRQDALGAAAAVRPPKAVLEETTRVKVDL